VNPVAVAVEIVVNLRQAGAGGGGQFVLSGEVLQPADHPGSHPAQQSKTSNFIHFWAIALPGS